MKRRFHTSHPEFFESAQSAPAALWDQALDIVSHLLIDEYRRVHEQAFAFTQSFSPSGSAGIPLMTSTLAASGAF